MMPYKMAYTKWLAVLLLIILTAPADALAKDFKISPADSSVDFEVPHEIGFTSGIIPVKDGAIEADEKTYQIKRIDLSLPVAGATTYNERRDEVLKSKDFFNAADFPVIKFTSRKIGERTLSAEVTIKNKTKIVEFDYRLAGFGKTEAGQGKVLVFVSGKLSKKDFDLTYNVTDDTGKPLLGDDLFVLMRLFAIE